MCLRCFMPYVLKNTRRIRVHRPRMKPSGGCQSFCFGFWTENGGWDKVRMRMGEEIREYYRLVIMCVFLLLMQLLIVLSFTQANKRRTTYTLTSTLHTLYVHNMLPHTHKYKGSHKKRVVKLLCTPPLSCVCPIRCHIITLCMIILVNLTRIKHAPHK